MTTYTVLTRRTLRLTPTLRLVRPLQTLGMCLHHLPQTLTLMQIQRIPQMNAVTVGKYFLSPTGSRDTLGKFTIMISFTNVRIVTRHSLEKTTSTDTRDLFMIRLDLMHAPTVMQNSKRRVP